MFRIFTLLLRERGWGNPRGPKKLYKYIYAMKKQLDGLKEFLILAGISIVLPVIIMWALSKIILIFK